MNPFEKTKNFIISDTEQKRAMLDDMLLKIPKEELDGLTDLLSNNDADGVKKLYDVPPAVMRIIQGFAFMTLTEAFLRRWEIDERKE